MLFSPTWDRPQKRVPRYRILETGEGIEGQLAKLPPANWSPVNAESSYYKLASIRRALKAPAGVDLELLARSVGAPADLAAETATRFLRCWCDLTAVRLNAGG